MATPGAPSLATTVASAAAVADGSAPPDSAVVHPGTLNAPGGGVKMAGPANHDGSPQQLPLNAAQIAAYGISAGLNADQTKTSVGALAGDMVQKGVLPWPTATRTIALMGNNAPYESDQAVVREGMSQAGQTQRTGMTIAGENYRAGIVPQVSTNADGTPTYTTTGAIAAAPPGSVTAFQPQKYASDSARQAAMDKVVNVYQVDANGKPDISKPPLPMTIRDALAQHRPLTPESSDAVNAILRGGALTGDVSGPAGRLADVVTQSGVAAQPPKTANEARMTLQGRAKGIEEMYAPREGTGGVMPTRHEPAQMTPQMEYALNDYADYLQRMFPRMSPDVANLTAQQHLMQQGYLPTQDQVQQWRTTKLGNLVVGNPDVQNQIVKGQTVGKFAVPLMKDYVSPMTGITVPANPDKGAPGTGGQPPRPPGAPAAAPAQPAPTNKGAPIGRAAPGKTPGSTVYVGAQKGVVGDDGLVYAAQ